MSEKSITVLALIADGRSYAQIVDGHSDISYHDIFLAAEEALRLSDAQPDHHERLARIKSRYQKAYERWTTAEDAKLATMHRDGTKIQEIAAHFQRQPSAIQSRLAKLDLKLGDQSQ